MSIEHKDVKIGDHCWAISYGEALVVMKVAEDFYDVCGAWECGIYKDNIEIIEIIKKPKELYGIPLYYLRKENAGE